MKLIAILTSGITLLLILILVSFAIYLIWNVLIAALIGITVDEIQSVLLGFFLILYIAIDQSGN